MKKLTIIAAAFAALAADAAITITGVTARQRWPWNSLVDVDFTISGAAAGEAFAIDINAEYAGGDKKLAAYNDFLRAEAAARKLPLADLNADMQALLKTYPPERKGNKLTADGVHMAWDGDRMMARGILLALGVSKDKIPEIEPAWRMMRGYKEYKISVSADEAKAIEERAKAEGLNVIDVARDALLGK